MPADMIRRILFAVVALGALGALFYLQQSDSGGGEGAAADVESTEPGYIATNADLIETDDDGHALFRLDAERIEQPTPQGIIFLTAPKLDYQPEAGNHWKLSAQRGQLPQDASTAELAGAVHADGRPTGSNALMHIVTDQLHLDMKQQLATTTAKVRVDWAGNSLRGRGMIADIKNDRLQLAADVHGALAH
jgi:LPS export ABC transporter protein LptC